MPVLRATLVENHMQGSGPKMGYSPTKRNQELCGKGWRSGVQVCRVMQGSGLGAVDWLALGSLP